MNPSQQNPSPGTLLRPNTSAPAGPFAVPAPPTPTVPAAPVYSPASALPNPYMSPIPPRQPPVPAPYGPALAGAPFASPLQSPFGQPAPTPLGPPLGNLPMPPYGLPPHPQLPGALPGPGMFPQPQIPPAYTPPAPYDVQTDPYDSHQKRPSVPGKKLALLAGGGTILLILLIVAAANFTSRTPANNRPAAPQSTGNLLPDILGRPDGTLELANKIDTSRSVKPQSIQAKVKEQINLSSGFSFLARGIGTYQTSTAQPQAGKKFVLVHVVVGNRAQAENLSVSYLDFKLRDAGDRLLSVHPHTQQITNNLLASPSELKPGEQIDGRLVYEVDAAEQEWTLVHKESYRKTTDNTTFTVEGRLVLDIKSEGKAIPPPATP